MFLNEEGFFTRSLSHQIPTFYKQLITNPYSFLCKPDRASKTAGRNYQKQYTTFSNGYLGSRNDEERSEMRYVMRIAEFSESSKF